MAYNGEVYGASGFRVLISTVQWISNSLEDQNRTMIIPWEVDQLVPTIHNIYMYQLLGLTP